jgi:hypothetical protein
MANQDFAWSDAWLLGAIFFAHRAETTATLDQVLAYGDAINHAIFTPEELESGLARLSDAGFIREENGAFIPTGIGQQWYEEFKSVQARRFDFFKWFSKKLGAQPYRPGNEHKLEMRYPGFTSRRYEEALSAYRRRAAETLRSLGV